MQPRQDVSHEEVREFQRGCVAINHLFLTLSEQGIMEYRDHWPKRTPRENIEWVGRDKTCRRKFRRILEGLDASAPMQEQAAYLLRAFSGLQMFPDANHRTGLIVVAFYLDAKGWRFSASPTDMVGLVERIRPLYGACRHVARSTASRSGTTRSGTSRPSWNTTSGD